MSFICLKKSEFNNVESCNNLFLIKIDIQEYFLRSSSSFISVKDTYFASNYILKITNPIKDINELDTNTYYICFDTKEKLFGLKKADSSFIRILEFERKSGIYDQKCPELKKQIFTLMIDNGFIELLNF